MKRIIVLFALNAFILSLFNVATGTGGVDDDKNEIHYDLIIS